MNDPLLDNYRPISIIPLFGKNLEKIIYRRLYSFCLAYDVIYDKQFGFREHHSTGHAINYSKNKITWREIQKKKCGVDLEFLKDLF